MIKIHEKSVLVAIKMETKKAMQKNIEKSWKMSKMDPKIKGPDAVIFWSSGIFCCAIWPWETKWLPRLPPRAPKTSPSLDFH